MLAYLPTCLLAHLPTCPLAQYVAHLPLTCSLAHLLTCSLAHLLTCSLAYLEYLHVLPTCSLTTPPRKSAAASLHTAPCHSIYRYATTRPTLTLNVNPDPDPTLDPNNFSNPRTLTLNLRMREQSTSPAPAPSQKDGTPAPSRRTAATRPSRPTAIAAEMATGMAMGTAPPHRAAPPPPPSPPPLTSPTASSISQPRAQPRATAGTLPSDGRAHHLPGRAHPAVCRDAHSLWDAPLRQAAPPTLTPATLRGMLGMDRTGYRTGRRRSWRRCTRRHMASSMPRANLRFDLVRTLVRAVRRPCATPRRPRPTGRGGMYEQWDPHEGGTHQELRWMRDRSCEAEAELIS